MKPTVVLSSFNVANFPEGGGHFWVYMQYALGLRRSGCDVYWMEGFVRGNDPLQDERAIAAFFTRMEAFGFGGKVILRAAPEAPKHSHAPAQILGMPEPEAEAVFGRTDLLLNFHYAIDP